MKLNFNEDFIEFRNVRKFKISMRFDIDLLAKLRKY